MTWITKYKPSRKFKDFFKTLDQNLRLSKCLKIVFKFKTFYLRPCRNPTNKFNTERSHSVVQYEEVFNKKNLE